jgi:spermidine/putrescine-binding protein
MVENDLDGVLQFAKDHRDRVKFWWPTSNEMILGLDHKDCAAGNMHSPEMLQALRESPNLGAIIPEADRAFVQLFWAIPEGTPNKELAERALDALFSPEMQLGFTRHGSATALLSVAKQRASEDPLWKQIYPHTEDQLRSLRYYPYDAYFRHWDDISTVWQREILRKA